MCIYVIIDMYVFKLSQTFTFLLSVSIFPFFGYFIFLHMCACVYVCASTRKHMCVWRQEENLECHL